MNKEELINQLRHEIESFNCLFLSSSIGSKEEGFSNGVAVGLEKAMVKLAKLDECKDERVEVSPEQAEWLDRNVRVHNRQQAIWKAYKTWFRENRADIPFDLDMPTSSNLFHQAVWKGYKTKPQPRYLVSYIHPVNKGRYYFMEFMSREDAKRITGKENPFYPRGTVQSSLIDAFVFYDKEAANHTAILVGGTVEIYK